VTAQKELWKKLLQAEKKSRSGKFSRWLRSPFRYPVLMLFNHLLYPVVKKGIYVRANTFFGLPLRTLLPSGTDVMLNGIKSHDSEIRLSKFLTRTLHEGDVFIDVGAHYGYYSLLASVLVGNSGKVYSIEASYSSFVGLKENIDIMKNINSYHAAAGDAEGSITFYEYPGPYAEYNTTVRNAYVGQKWYQLVKEKVNTVPILIPDHLLTNEGIVKATLKIDVEGGEAAVIRGLQNSLAEKDLVVAMEYLLPSEGSKLHREAADLLYAKGYQSYAITDDGTLTHVADIDEYLKGRKLNSDNIIFNRAV